MQSLSSWNVQGEHWCQHARSTAKSERAILHVCATREKKNKNDQEGGGVCATLGHVSNPRATSKAICPWFPHYSHPWEKQLPSVRAKIKIKRTIKKNTEKEKQQGGVKIRVWAPAIVTFNTVLQRVLPVA